MLLGHESRPEARGFGHVADLVAPSIEPSTVRQFLARHGYNDEIEAAAEDLATALVTQLARNADADALRQDAVSERLR